MLIAKELFILLSMVHRCSRPVLITLFKAIPNPVCYSRQLLALMPLEEYSPAFQVILKMGQHTYGLL